MIGIETQDVFIITFLIILLRVIRLKYLWTDSNSKCTTFRVTFGVFEAYSSSSAVESSSKEIGIIKMSVSSFNLILLLWCWKCPSASRISTMLFYNRTCLCHLLPHLCKSYSRFRRWQLTLESPFGTSYISWTFFLSQL